VLRSLPAARASCGRPSIAPVPAWRHAQRLSAASPGRRMPNRVQVALSLRCLPAPGACPRTAMPQSVAVSLTSHTASNAARRAKPLARSGPRQHSQSAAHLTAPRPPARRRPRAPHPPRRRRRPRSRRSGPAHAPVCAPCCQKPRPTAAPRAAAPARGPRPAQQPQGRVAILNPTLHNCPSASLCALASWTRHRGTRPCLQSGRSASSMSDKHSAPNASAGRGWHGGVQPRRGAPGRPLSWARAGTAGRGAARLAQALNGAYRDAAQDVAQNGHVL